MGRASHRRLFALLPAAGRSRRFGRDKLTFKINGTELIKQVLDPFLRSEHVAKVFVITRSQRRDLEALVCTGRVEFLFLSRDTADMRQTVEEGIRLLESLGEPGESDALLITPADVIGITTDILAQLSKVAARTPEAICIPRVNGRRAHPLLLPWRLRSLVEAIPEGKGLNWLLNSGLATILEVEVSAPNQVDIDSNADLRRVVATAPAHKDHATAGPRPTTENPEVTT